jgi:hypothetical protein
MRRVTLPGPWLSCCLWATVVSVGQLWLMMQWCCVLVWDKLVHHATQVIRVPRGGIDLGLGAVWPFPGRLDNVGQTWGGAPIEVAPSPPSSSELARSSFWSCGDTCFFPAAFSASFTSFLISRSRWRQLRLSFVRFDPLRRCFAPPWRLRNRCQSQTPKMAWN